MSVFPGRNKQELLSFERPRDDDRRAAFRLYGNSSGAWSKKRLFWVDTIGTCVLRPAMSLFALKVL